MTQFADIIKEASKGRLAKEMHYRKVREERWQELKVLAEESDLMLDGRRRRHRLPPQQANA